ncbi:MAG: ABC transporter substrate-binding protein [Frankia sp.]|nr:ABC transporter substrate-binding protein [Frankia sp.]
MDVSQCGTDPGVRATGEPIKLGAIVTDQPGTSFTDIPYMARAYFECVNDNGGINGRPIEYVIETEQTQPDQVSAAARKLVETDQVLGIVGNTSIIECSVNHEYWESVGYYVIDSGIAPECYSTPNSAAVNMGPRYSSDGAVQYVLAHGAKKVVFDQSNVPGTDYIAAGPQAIADDAGVPITQLTEDVPINDANSVALRLVQEAGPDGAVVLNFTPPEALKILQAAEDLNIHENIAMWACSTPCNTDFLAAELGDGWENLLFVNAELTPLSESSETIDLYRAILEEYGDDVQGGAGSFSQMGFVEARIMVDALRRVEGEFTPETVNAAIRETEGFDTGMLCEPWTYGDFPLHIPNNVDYTVTPRDGVMVIADDGGCTPISDVDPHIAQYRAAVG